MPQGPFLRKYGEAATVPFSLFEADGINFRVDAVHAAGDTVVTKDEGAEANTTNGFVDEGNGYSILLSATEMQAARIVIYVIDQTATKVWLDDAIVIETYGNASAQHAFDLDTANVTVGTNNDKTGYSVSGTITTLDGLNNVSTTDINNQVADVIKTDTNGEPAQGAPPLNASIETKIQYLYTELRNKIVVDTNTANQKQVFGDDTTTILYEKNLTNASDVTTIAEAQTGA